MTSDYGNYRLAFEPPADQITPSVEMTLSGEADLTQMLAFFEAFLQASGYQLGAKTLKLEGNDTFQIDTDGFINFGHTPMSFNQSDFI